jgi:hypothetical protein
MTTAAEDTVAERPICSSKGCTRPAEWDLLWNNPKLHTPERRKVWLACAEHKESLSDFLTARGFLRAVVEHGSEDSAADR